jgi:S1-C subfamily serine protease
MFAFTCPKCQTINQVKTIAAGAVAACSHCRQPLRIVPQGEGPTPGGAAKGAGGWNTPLLTAFGGLAGLAVAAVMLVVSYLVGRSPAPAAARPALEPIKEWASAAAPAKEEKDPEKRTLVTPTAAAEQPALTGEQISRRLLKSACWIVAQEREGSKVLTGSGSGTLVDRDERLVLTNEHVANDRSVAVHVLFPMYRGGRLVTRNAEYREEILRGGGIKARVVHWDRRRDLALLQLERLPEDVVALRLAARAPQTGQQIHTLGGSPRGNQGQWVYTPGAVRVVSPEKWRYTGDSVDREGEVIASTALINAGDSGGGLVNDRCALVGVNNGLVSGNGNARHVSITEVIDFLTGYYRKIGKPWTPPAEEVGPAADEKEIARLLDALEAADNDKEGRAKAVNGLRDLGPGARAAIRALVKVAGNADESEDLRESAVEALKAIGAPNRDDIEVVIRALHDRKTFPELRRYAASALGPLAAKATDALSALLMAVSDRDAGVRRNAAASLGQAGPAARNKVIPPLIRLLRDKDKAVRSAALQSVIRYGDPERSGVDFAREKATLADRSVPAEARSYACALLSLTEEPDAMPVICDALQSNTDFHLAFTVLNVLDRHKPRTKEVAGALSRGLDHKESAIRERSARVQSGIGFDPVLFPGYLTAMSTRDAAVSRVALDILKTRMGDCTAFSKKALPLSLTRDSLESLKAALAGLHPLGRQVAAYALGTLGEEGAPAAASLRTALKKEGWKVVRREMLATFAQMGPAALKELGSQGEDLLDDLAKIATDARTDTRNEQVCAAIAIIRLAPTSRQARQAYPVLARAMLLKNAHRPEKVDAIELELHERAKQALARGGADAADALAKTCSIAFFAHARLDPPDVQRDKRHARKTTFEILARIGPPASISSVHNLFAFIEKLRRPRGGGEFPDVIAAKNEAAGAVGPRPRRK